MDPAAPHILVVDDEPEMRRLLADMLRKPGWRVSLAADGQEALSVVAQDRPDAVLTDLNMPRMDGLALLRHLQQAHPGLPVVVLTAYGSVPGAVEAMRAGAFDYLPKPVQSPAALREVLGRALESAGALPSAGAADEAVVAADPAFLEVLATARSVADHPTTVLLLGESGVGKEVLARYLHAHSPRAEGPFVAVSCAALPETLLESELFGHEKGAFTGAVRTHRGTFERAHGGTLLLDEVGEMAPALQAKFLRVLETRRITRLGGAREIPVDVRIVAATNRELTEEVRAGRFREDLYFRLSVFPIRIPPLRERPKDILPLARHFVNLLGRRAQGRPPRLSPEAEAALRSYTFPGNVRELANLMERAVVLAGGGDILPAHLGLGGISMASDLGAPLPQAARRDEGPSGAPPGSGSGSPHPAPDGVAAPPGVPDGAAAAAPEPSGGLPSGHSAPEAGQPLPLATDLRELERRAILQALEQTGGNRKQAARLLGIARRTLQYKLKKYGIE